jgi:hypothetical protein
MAAALCLLRQRHAPEIAARLLTDYYCADLLETEPPAPSG